MAAVIPAVWGWAAGAFGTLAAGGAVGGLTAASWVGLGASALSAFSTYSAGQAQKRELEDQARQEAEGARTEIIRGRQSENEILDRVVDVIAQQRVAFGAAGIDPFSGSASRIAADALQRGERAIGVTRDNSTTAYFTRRQTALALRKRGSAAGLGGLIGGAAQAGQGVAGALNRGTA